MIHFLWKAFRLLEKALDVNTLIAQIICLNDNEAKTLFKKWHPYYGFMDYGLRFYGLINQNGYWGHTLISRIR